MDEVLTPDSSRFWPVDSTSRADRQPSFDKQPLRDYLDGGTARRALERRNPPPPSAA